jgi:hypothetical protein
MREGSLSEDDVKGLKRIVLSAENLVFDCKCRFELILKKRGRIRVWFIFRGMEYYDFEGGKADFIKRVDEILEKRDYFLVNPSYSEGLGEDSPMTLAGDLYRKRKEGLTF